jgi:hypothetical protein
MKIKVQIYGGASVTSLLSGGISDDSLQNPLTFIAYSDAMKARVLENFLKSPAKIDLSFFDGPAKDGEWHEPPIQNAVFNR